MSKLSAESQPFIPRYVSPGKLPPDHGDSANTPADKISRPFEEFSEKSEAQNSDVNQEQTFNDIGLQKNCVQKNESASKKPDLSKYFF